jgi:hypothetical protein
MALENRTCYQLLRSGCAFHKYKHFMERGQQTMASVVGVHKDSGRALFCLPAALAAMDRYSTAIRVPWLADLDTRSMRASITLRIALRNSIREFARCSFAAGGTPKRSRT